MEGSGDRGGGGRVRGEVIKGLYKTRSGLERERSPNILTNIFVWFSVSTIKQKPKIKIQKRRR
jgi:hypothetical protein